MREWLMDLRHEKGMTQVAVAQNAKISRAYYTQIETGVRSPSPKVAKRIASVLAFAWTRFFDDESSGTF